MKATFLTAQQKQHLHKLGEILSHIESCDTLGEIDPAYYGNKRKEYISQYALQIGAMLKNVKHKSQTRPQHCTTQAA